MQGPYLHSIRAGLVWLYGYLFPLETSLEMEKSDIIDIIIPAHNEELYLGGLLGRLKDYGFPSNCITVVDVCSKDKTKEIAVSHGVNIVSLSAKACPSVARNIGVKATDREVLVFLDADILVTASWVEYLGKLSIGQSSIYGDTYNLSLNPGWIERYWFTELLDRKKSYINGGNLLMSRSVFEKIGGFDETLETGEDVDFSEKARKLGIEIQFEKDLYVHHEGNPKGMSSFVRREKWHGAGDLRTIRDFITSTVAVASALFVLLHLVVITLLLFAPYLGLALISAIPALCMLVVVLKFGLKRPIKFLLLSLICYLYLLGRSFSIFAKVKKTIVK